MLRPSPAVPSDNFIPNEGQQAHLRLLDKLFCSRRAELSRISQTITLAIFLCPRRANKSVSRGLTVPKIRLVYLGFSAQWCCSPSAQLRLYRREFTQKAHSADTALMIAQGAFEKCRADGHRITIAIIDSSNSLKAFVRDDGSGIVSFDPRSPQSFHCPCFSKPPLNKPRFGRPLEISQILTCPGSPRHCVPQS